MSSGGPPSPQKRLKTVPDSDEDGGGRRLRLRACTPSQTGGVRMSPRKSGPPPNTPSSQPRMEPRGKDASGGGAKVPAATDRETQVRVMKVKMRRSAG